MYVQVVVETPQNLTKRQRELLAEFEKLSSKETQPESAGFFGKVKDFFDGIGQSGRRSALSLTLAVAPIPVTDYSCRSSAVRSRMPPMQSARPANARKENRNPHSSFGAEKRPPLRRRGAFIRSWIEKPLAIGAVTPSGKVLARTMARYVDPDIAGPVIELGPGTGPVTEALVEQRRRSGAAGAGRVQSDLLPAAAHALSGGDRGAGRRLPARAAARRPAAASRRRRWCPACRCSPSRCSTRLRLIDEAFALMAPDAPFVQFTYAMVPPIPKTLAGVARGGLRADLDEPAAGAGLGLSQGLIALASSWAGSPGIRAARSMLRL